MEWEQSTQLSEPATWVGVLCMTVRGAELLQKAHGWGPWLAPGCRVVRLLLES
jgi:hypothetical protein